MSNLSISIAAQVVAAGVYGDEGRVTISFTPLVDKDGASDLSRWPEAVESLLASPAMEIYVLKKGESWRDVKFDTADVKTAVGAPFALSRIGPATPSSTIGDYWRKVMAADDGKGFDYLYAAMGPSGADPLTETMRDPETTVTSSGKTPDIHGTARSRAVAEHSFERAQHIAGRLKGELRATRKFEAQDAIGTAIEQWHANPVLPLQRLAAPALADTRIASLTEDEAAWTNLADSRGRADLFGDARKLYQNAQTAQAGIDALLKAQGKLFARTPSAAAFNVGVANKSTGALDLDMDEATAAYRLASLTPTGSDDAPLPFPTQSDEIELARRRLFTIQTNPSLGRVFRFVVDFEFRIEDLEARVSNASYYDETALDWNALDGDLTSQKEIPSSDPKKTCFFLIKLAGGAGPQIWSMAKLRPRVSNMPTSSGHFFPCTREEIDARAAGNSSDDFRSLAIAEQIDGIVDLGQHIVLDDGSIEPRYDILTLDAITTTGADYSTSNNLRENASTVASMGDQLHGSIRSALLGTDDPQNATQRGGGLVLSDRWRQLHTIWRHLDSLQQQTQFGDPKANVILDASDLTVGYKLDVGITLKNDTVARNRWHTLMHRYVKYSHVAKFESGTARGPLGDLDAYISTLYQDRTARQEAEDGHLHVPTALRDWSQAERPLHPLVDNKRDWTTAFTEETIGAWRGDPLGVACGVATHQLDASDVKISMSYDLPKRTTAEALTPMQLRFGWPYHLGLRAMFAGGISLPLSRALGHYEKSFGGGLVLPSAKAQGRSYCRHERIDAPTVTVPDWVFGTLSQNQTYTSVALQGRFPAPQSLNMFVRTCDDPQNRAELVIPDGAVDQDRMPGIGFDRRIITAPPVSLEFATLHDAFRNYKASDFQYDVKMCEPRVLDDGKGGSELPLDPTVEQVNKEFVAVPVTSKLSSDPKARWGVMPVAWKSYRIRSRPRGGLTSVDYRAAWGGFPVYRARFSDGAVEPVEGAPVVPLPDPVTDEGEILHRSKTAGFVVFPGDAEKRRTVLWAAGGTLALERGLPERVGTSVFRPLPRDRTQDDLRMPYYPDPAATSLVVEVTIAGQSTPSKPVQIPLYTDERLAGPAPLDYPDAIPVAIDVVRSKSKVDEAHRVSVSPPTKYGALPNTPKGTSSDVKVAHVSISLAPGEEARIRCWCAPSETFVTYMWAQNETIAALAVTLGSTSGGNARTKSQDDVDGAFAAGIKKLAEISIDRAAITTPEREAFALGSLRLPSRLLLRALAAKIRAALLEKPIPEIGAVTELFAVHAVDLPQQEPAGDPKGPKWAALRVSKEEADHILQTPVDNADQLTDPANWTLENQMADATDILLDGAVSVHGASTGAIEIWASGAAAARGRFDDVDRGRSRDDLKRGLWPKPDALNYMQPQSLFGFAPQLDGSVQFTQERVTLLRVEGFEPKETRIDLLVLQRLAAELEASGDDTSPLRVSRPAAFPDGKARYLALGATAISRHANALRSRYDEVPDRLSRPPTTVLSNDSKDVLHRFWLAATVRPARPVSQSPLPSFAWLYNAPSGASDAERKTKLPEVSVTRSMRVRIRFKRPWASAGEGERVGIVIWPPNLFKLDGSDVRNDKITPPPVDRVQINLRELPKDGSGIPEMQDEDLGLGGAYVTRWGADPILEQGQPQGWLLSKENFPGAQVLTNPASIFAVPPEQHPRGPRLVENVLMPIPANEDATKTSEIRSTADFMAVSLVTYSPSFDPEQENWYVDIDLSPCGAVYPFVRFGIVRYQPNAPRYLQVSEPISEWAQIMPERRVTATARSTKLAKSNKVLIEAQVHGAFSGPSALNPNAKIASDQASQVHFSLLRRRLPRDGGGVGPESVFFGPLVQSPQCATDCMTWSASFEVPDDVYGQTGERWSIFVEEFDRYRPARYPDEPRYETRVDTVFTDTGPKFAARLPLDYLLIRPVSPN